MLGFKIALFLVSLCLESSSFKQRFPVRSIDYPYSVRIRIRKSEGPMICTGSLIHPGWILTSARCTTGYKSIRVQAAVTENSTIDSSKERSVEEVIPYPGFVNILTLSGMNLMNDYSLIKLEHEFQIDNVYVKLVALENKTWTYGTVRNCMAVGVGVEDDEEGLYAFNIHAYHGTCPCKTKTYLLDRYICSVIDEQYESTICPGDLGGPLICDEKQVGIASHTFPSHGCDLFSSRSSNDFGCNVPGTVSTFTYVCPVLSWIRKYVGDSIPIQPTYC